MVETQAGLRRTFTEADYTDFAHTGPGTLAGRYLRMFWQAVYRSEDLPVGWAKPIRLMSEDHTLYRGHSGQPYLVAFRCAHRGTQLSVGSVEGDSIRCWYHGWKYDGSGQCVEQPAEPRPFCEKVKIKSYPVQEYLGLIFAYVGDGEPPEFPRYPNFEEAEGVRYVEANYRDCNYFLNIENNLDRVHVGFAHGALPGTVDGRTDSPVIHVEETEWGIKGCSEHPSGKKVYDYMGIPNVQMVLSGFPVDAVSGLSGREFISWKVPLDDEHHVQFLVATIRTDPETARLYEEQRAKRLAKQATFDHRELAKKILAGKLRLKDVDPETTEIVLLQDDLAQCGQRPIPDHSAEWLGQSDNPLRLIRRLWEREVRALAEGRPLKKWTFKPDQVSAHPE